MRETTALNERFIVLYDREREGERGCFFEGIIVNVGNIMRHLQPSRTR